jgi:hypothetical protein
METFKVILFRILFHYNNIELNVYRIIILLFVRILRILMFREKCRTRDFEDGVLRDILGPKSNGEAGKWRRLHNEEHNKLYSTPRLFGHSTENE